MDFRILGPLEVLDQGRVVALGGHRQRALLALLLLRVNEPLGFDRLIEELWGEQRPGGADRTLHVNVSRLRKTLEPGLVVTRGRSYVLTLDPECLDAQRFERLLAEGTRELAAEHHARAVAAFTRALAEWRGSPLADLGYQAFAESEIRRLEDLRRSVLELQIEAELSLGLHADVVDRLPTLIREDPLRENLRGQLMLALYRSNRQADALQAYRDARHDLVEQLGIEPGERLRDLHRAILAQDPALLPRAVHAPTAAPAPPVAARRLVTVVVASLLGAPASLDLEDQHRVLGNLEAICSDAFERHGGSVERFDGERVVGTFGLASLHEDDALRAVRAALEVRAVGAVAIGIDSGEVYVGSGARGVTFATGDVRRVAARLDDAAGDGEILLGELTQRLVATDVVSEPVEPLTVRGRQAAVRAYRLLDLHPSEPVWAGPPPTSMIDREGELARLHAVLGSATSEPGCRVATVLGPPGIGKSRLAREFIDGVGDAARVVVGRCLSYGDGITYRPLAEVIDQLSSGDPVRGLAPLLAGDPEADAVTRHVLGAIGLGEAAGQADETSWAVRRLLEAAAERPLVMVIEDAHWAEPTLLDLLDYVASFSTGAPLMLLCLARPELLETHPAWSAPHAERALLELDALSDAQSRAFVDQLAIETLPWHSASRIVATAEGNPLFLEQLVAVGAEHLAVLPPSIEAVLAARIERLEPDERAVLLHASVEGRRFHRGAVAALIGTDGISAALIGLVHKQLIRPDRPEFAGEDGFRFAHALIREAAYAGMPRRTRADLHERLAGWLKLKPRVPDELLGYHLEQAYLHRVEIGVAGEHDLALAREGADRLATAARAALARGVADAGARLLERAVALLEDDDPARPELVSGLIAALVDAGRLTDAGELVTGALTRAVFDGDTRFESRARVDQQLVRLHAGTSGGHEEARQIAEVALAHLELHGDNLGQCRAWRLQAWIDWIEGSLERADEAWQRAALHARRAGDARELFDILGWRASAAVLGPTPVADAILRCNQIRDHVRNSSVAVAITLHPLGLLHAMTGDFEQAHELIREGNEILGELGRMESAVSHHEAIVELMAGRPDRAEERLRPGYEELERMGERELLSTTAAILAQAVYAQERFDEAGELCALSERIAASEDIVTQIMWRGMRARLAARQGEAARAETLGREAVRLAERTDLLVLRGDAWMDLEDVARQTGRPADAQAAARKALEHYERKGDRPSAARARIRVGPSEERGEPVRIR